MYGTRSANQTILVTLMVFWYANRQHLKYLHIQKSTGFVKDASQNIRFIILGRCFEHKTPKITSFISESTSWQTQASHVPDDLSLAPADSTASYCFKLEFIFDLWKNIISWRKRMPTTFGVCTWPCAVSQGTTINLVMRCMQLSCFCQVIQEPKSTNDTPNERLFCFSQWHTTAHFFLLFLAFSQPHTWLRQK